MGALLCVHSGMIASHSAVPCVIRNDLPSRRASPAPPPARGGGRGRTTRDRRFRSPVDSSGKQGAQKKKAGSFSRGLGVKSWQRTAALGACHLAERLEGKWGVRLRRG